MARNVESTTLAQVQAAKCYLALLAFFDFQGGAVRVWTGYGNLVYGGNTFTGLGDLGTVSPVEETTELRANGLAFTLNGIPSSMLSSVLNETYRGRAVTLWLATLTSAGAITGTPYPVFQGKTDMFAVAPGAETCSITITAENRAIDFLRNLDRRYTHDDQQINFPGDDGFIYVADSMQKNFQWGGSGQSAGASGGGGGGTWHGVNLRMN